MRPLDLRLRHLRDEVLDTEMGQGARGREGVKTGWRGSLGIGPCKRKGLGAETGQG